MPRGRVAEGFFEFFDQIRAEILPEVIAVADEAVAVDVEGVQEAIAPETVTPARQKDLNRDEQAANGDAHQHCDGFQQPDAN